jgi:hypothetical protein
MCVIERKRKINLSIDKDNNTSFDEKKQIMAIYKIKSETGSCMFNLFLFDFIYSILVSSSFM